MNRSCSGFYHDPPVWIDARPADFDQLQGPTTTPWQQSSFDSFREEVFREKITESIELRVTREGRFEFQFAGWRPGTFPREVTDKPTPFEKTAEVILNRTLVMNTYLAFMYSRLLGEVKLSIDRMVITPELVISLDSLDDNSGMGFGNTRVSHLALSSFPSTYRTGLPFSMDDRVSMRAIVPLNVVKEAAKDLKALLKDYDVDGLVLCDLFLRASKAYQEHNYSLALITNWAVIENLLQNLWRQYQDDNATRDGKLFIDSKRREKLQDSRTFTAAVVIEALSLNSVITHELYPRLSEIRKARNDWTHDLKKISADTAHLSTASCEEMFGVVKNITLRGQTGLKLHG